MMNQSKSSAEGLCQRFEFVLRRSGGTEVFIYDIPVEEAARLESLLDNPRALEPEHRVIAFTIANGRLIHLNLCFLVAATRIDLIRRSDDPDPPPGSPGPSPGSGWQSLNHPEAPPELALFVHGLEKPVVCISPPPGEIELAATLLVNDSEMAIVSVSDEEFPWTRYIPARNIILMDSLNCYLNDETDSRSGEPED